MGDSSGQRSRNNQPRCESSKSTSAPRASGFGGSLMAQGKLVGLPRFVSFFGPDGAGKTTHARLLAAYYEANGWRVRVAWIRANHILAFVLSRFFIKMGYYRIEPR